MQSSFKFEVLIMYRHYLKLIMKRPLGMRESLLIQTRNEFKRGAKIPRKNIPEVDHFYSTAERKLHELRESNIERVSTFTPRQKK
ncbi:unnamed protein product [Blepharisma stoltei]|uniref:Complex 1 LYR protein domain-containing protein n=1 Tax=Blepharisma stoltei TaxID=1481888 RepID=A0AAU9KQM6_9CILI|nr:unnamed protein product [Blepharisma stoltei]